MYCNECHKQSPENFVTCAYCGAQLNSGKKKVPSRYIKKSHFKFKIPFKTVVVSLVILATVLAVAAAFTASFTGTKSEKVAKSFVASIENYNEELFYSLYDDNIKKYKQENRYFGEEETYEHFILPLKESDDFYKEKCGDGYTLTYNIKSTLTLTEKELQTFNGILEKSFEYIEFPSQVDILSVEITAKGENGGYTSMYNDFWCMKIKGHWYKVDKTVYTEYNEQIL